VASIFGQREKPGIGSPPDYIKENIIQIQDLTKTDNLVLKMSCEKALKVGHLGVEPEGIFINEKGDFNIPELELLDSLDVLERRGLIQSHKTTGVKIYRYSITTYGFDEYVRAYVSEYDNVLQKVLHILAMCESTDNYVISAEVDAKDLVIDHVIEVLEENGYIKKTVSMVGARPMLHVYDISPEIRRMLEG